MEDYDINKEYPKYESDPHGQFYGSDNPELKKKPIWAAITSFVLALISLVTCCCTTPVTSVLALIFGLISLFKKWGGKGLAITGVILSVVTIAYMTVSCIMCREVFEDIIRFSNNAESYISEYNETGEIPEEFSKYLDEKYDKYFKAMGMDGFKEFYDNYIREMEQTLNTRKYAAPESSGSEESGTEERPRDNNFGERPVNI